MLAASRAGRNRAWSFSLHLPGARVPFVLEGRLVDRASQSGARRRAAKSASEGPAPPGLLTTGEVMERSGLSRQVLYQYTAMGLIREAHTTPAGYRLYPESALRHLEIVKELKETGYTLRDIKELFFVRSKGN
jgi:hypothetical protein